MQIKNAAPASLMRQSDIHSGLFSLIKPIVWYAVCQDDYSEFQLNHLPTFTESERESRPAEDLSYFFLLGIRHAGTKASLAR